MAQWQIGATVIAPIDVDVSEEKVGVLHEALDGARSWGQRIDGAGNPITKRRWKLGFDNVVVATRDALRTVFRAITTYTLTDEYGATATVIVEPASFHWSRVHRGGEAPRYNVSIELLEV